MEGLSIDGKRAVYRLGGTLSPDLAADNVREALEICRVQGVRELVADLHEVAPTQEVGLGSRAFYIREWFRASSGKVRLAVVVKPELIDPKKFGETFAGSIGLQAKAFVTVEDAVQWLDSLPAT